MRDYGEYGKGVWHAFTFHWFEQMTMIQHLPLQGWADLAQRTLGGVSELARLGLLFQMSHLSPIDPMLWPWPTLSWLWPVMVIAKHYLAQQHSIILGLERAVWHLSQFFWDTSKSAGLSALGTATTMDENSVRVLDHLELMCLNHWGKWSKCFQV